MQEKFERYEKKYLISIEQYQNLMSTMITRLTPDTYGKHLISNIYFDTSDYDLIRVSLEKPCYKEKLRLRSYGIPNEDSDVFIELKKKFDGVVYKRRISMKLADARKYLYYGIRPEGGGQIVNEVNYVMDFYELKPMVYLSYERIAFYAKENPELRVTFDMNIRAREYELELPRGNFGIPILNEGQMLMEVKIPGAMPAWMSRLFSELGIYPVSYSKYGTFYQNYIQGKGLEKGGRICA